MANTGVVYDVAVIGAGVMGSAAAYQITKNGAKVVLLEQVIKVFLYKSHQTVKT